MKLTQEQTNAVSTLLCRKQGKVAEKQHVIYNEEKKKLLAKTEPALKKLISGHKAILKLANEATARGYYVHGVGALDIKKQNQDELIMAACKRRSDWPETFDVQLVLAKIVLAGEAEAIAMLKELGCW